jgi:hypothetical protein
MATSNPFSNLSINRETIKQVVADDGYSDFDYKKIGTLFHLSCSKDNKQIKIAVYENKNGSTTLSCLNGQDKVAFAQIATLIAEKCAIGAPEKVEFSVRDFDSNSTPNFFDFLASESIEVTQLNPNQYCTQRRFRGKQGDTLTVNFFTNGTLQCQGQGGMLAALAIDYLGNVLNHKKSIALQLETFKIDMTVDAALDGLAGKLSKSYSKLGETVRAQFASALALTKMKMELADFGAIAFPALRGLEGVLKCELTNAGFDLTRFGDFGEYFESVGIDQYSMKALHAAKANEPRATELAEIYTLFHKQRHGLAHMRSDPEASRILTTMDEAKSIVHDVFSSIERFFGVVYP